MGFDVLLFIILGAKQSEGYSKLLVELTSSLGPSHSPQTARPVVLQDSRLGLIICQLYPIDDDMEIYCKEYESDVQSRIAGAKNTMLAMATPLESAPLSSQKSKSVSVPEVKKADIEDTNQKAGLLVGLLAVRALNPTVALLSKFPWLVDVRTEIADLLIRILKVSLSPLYESLLITKERNPSLRIPKHGTGYPESVILHPKSPF